MRAIQLPSSRKLQSTSRAKERKSITTTYSVWTSRIARHAWAARKEIDASRKTKLSPALDKIAKADAIIIGSPIYISAETATTKALIDRFYSFLAPGVASGQYMNRMPKGKKGAMLFTCGNPQGIELYSPVIARYQNQFQRLGIEGIVILVPSVNPGMKVLETPRGQKALEEVIQHVSG